MLNFTDIVLRRGPRVLLEKLSLSIYAGQHVGIVGRNGTGKSSLFAMIQGELAPDAGDLQMPRGLVIAHVRQETPALPGSALDYVLDGDAEWRELSQQIERAEQDHAGDKLAGLHERMHAIDGYTAPARAAQLLHGLGFEAGDELRAVKDFSGGWRMRLNLAQALMCRSDLLLLDEPTNHLDLDAVIWLQSWLASYAGTLMLISHDREFLDAVATHILHLEGQGGVLYAGNYSSSERQRAERLNQQAAQYKSQVRRAEDLQRFIDRFRAKASKARQAQSRLKQLEKMEINAPAHWDAPFRFEFPEPARLPSPLLKLEDLAIGYPGKTLLKGLNLTLEPGDRIGLLGRNGAGKTTLMQTLGQALPPQGGKIHRDRYLNAAYFAQHQIDSLRLDSSPIAHLQRLAPEAREQQLRDFLGGFDFHGDRVFEVIEPFSGGEKARLALALLAFQEPNLLLMDEPTNHLDLDMRHALELALQSFAGAIVLVSHDRHLIDSCCDELWLVDSGRCVPFDGDLDDYARHLREQQRQDANADASADKSGRASAKDQRREAAQQREREKPLRDAIRKLDKQMSQLHAELQKLDAELSDPELYTSNAARAAELMRKQGELRRQLEPLEEEWLALSEQLEQGV